MCLHIMGVWPGASRSGVWVTPGDRPELAGYQNLRQQPGVRKEGLQDIRKILSLGKADIGGLILHLTKCVRLGES